MVVGRANALHKNSERRASRRRGWKGFMRIGNVLAVGALLAVGLALPCAAQSGCADCSGTFALNSTDSGSGTVDGTLTLNPVTGLFTAADLTIADFPNPSEDGALTVLGQQGVQNGEYFVNVLPAGSSVDELRLFLPTNTLNGFDGSSVTDLSEVIVGGTSVIPVSGTLETASVTPEPGSLLLLATGLLGLAGFWWRRRFAA